MCENAIPTQPDGTSDRLEVMELGRLDYDKAFALQKRLAAERVAGEAGDRLLLVEHPPVITLGRGGGDGDVLASPTMLRDQGVALVHTDRGGKATFHGPGQLVAYPILKLRDKDLHAYMRRMLDVVAALLRHYGLEPQLGLRGPGVWVNEEKIASIGMAVRKWVTFHGIALNVNLDLNWFSLINPCGYAEERMTSMRTLLGRPVDMDAVKTLYVREFCKIFGYQPPAIAQPARPLRPVATARPETPRTAAQPARPARPDWLRVTVGAQEPAERMERLLSRLHLGTVCQEANCPNMGECFTRGTSTFMILGTVCTRGCRYCAVDKGLPSPLDPAEPDHVGEAVATLGLRHAVVTSVTRDDLPDGGAGQFVRTIAAIRSRRPEATVEVLVPDFAGDVVALQRVCDAAPDVFNHNIETVRRLFPLVRPRAGYELSLAVLRHAAGQGLPVKSGLMLGLGETDQEIRETLGDLLEAGCRFLTLGQYLAPSPQHAPIDRYVTPEQFATWEATARAMGFTGVASGPLVRSSYRAEDMLPPSQPLPRTNVA